MDTDKANENLSTIQIPCRMDERGVLPAANLSVHRCAPAAEMVLLASCSQDDDNYDSDMYTLAEMGTRLGGGGDPGNGEAPTPKPPKEYPYSVRKNNQTIEVNNVTTSNANFDLDFVVDSAFTTLRCEFKP